MFQIFITVMEIGKLSRPVTHTGPHRKQIVARADLQIARSVSNISSLHIFHQFEHVEPTWQQRHKLLKSSPEIQFFLWVDIWHKNQVKYYYSLDMSKFVQLIIHFYLHNILPLPSEFITDMFWPTQRKFFSPRSEQPDSQVFLPLHSVCV